LIWTGSAFIVTVYMVALMLLVGYGFVAGREELVETNVLLTLGLLLAYALEHLYVYIGAALYVVPLYGTDFFVFYLPLLLASLAALYLTRNRSRFAMLESVQKRMAVAL